MTRALEQDGDFTRDLVARLASPGALAGPVDRVDTLQTHISWLIFAGEHVYKIKKPVDLGFLDFSTRERRLHFCREEIRLNRRMAPDVYVDVAPVTVEADGRVTIDGAGEVVEHAVHMKRLPHSRMMNALLERGEIDNRRLRSLADRLVRFHAAARTGDGVDGHGAPECVARLMIENFDATGPFVERPDESAPALRLTGHALHDHLRRHTECELERLREVMSRRVDVGKSRDGHGDLHAGNICFVDDTVVAYDCIEFSEALRCGDVACAL